MSSAFKVQKVFENPRPFPVTTVCAQYGMVYTLPQYCVFIELWEFQEFTRGFSGMEVTSLQEGWKSCMWAIGTHVVVGVFVVVVGVLFVC